MGTKTNLTLSAFAILALLIAGASTGLFAKAPNRVLLQGI
jgi:hypothetical protein